MAEIKPQTNADRIREMSDEELAEFFDSISDCPPEEYDKWCRKGCRNCWLAWLRSPVEENDE